MADEALVLVRRVGLAHGAHEQPVELGRGDPVEHQLVDVGEARVAEVAVAVDLEVVVGQLAVGGELLLVGEVLAVADLEVAPRVEVQPRLAAR